MLGVGRLPSPGNPPGVGPTQTLLGHGHPPPFLPPPVAPIAGQSSEPSAPAPYASGAASSGAAKTIVGLPPLQLQVPAHPPVQAGQPALPVAPGAPPSSNVPSQFKTVLGVARPGIAPLNPGVPKPDPRVAYSAPPLAAPPVYSAHPGQHYEPRTTEGRPPPRKLAWISTLVVMLALGLLGAAAYVIFAKKPSGMTATLQTNDKGVEVIELLCTECADGTTARLSSSSGTFKAGRAELPLATPLRVGDNALSLALSAPGSERSREVAITVPVQYRIRGDFAGLSEARPQLRVLVEALPKTAVVIDGRAVPLDSAGKGTYALDVATELTGAAGAVTALSRVVPYTITPPGQGAQSGKIRLQIGIVPLLVTAPGESIVVESPNFMLAGQTQADGTVSVAGRPITVDVNGRFAQLMSVSAVGETTIEVRASAPNHAPRLFPLRVKRVASLTAEATKFSASATRGLESIARDPELKKGWAVVLAGKLVEVRSEHHTSISLLEVPKGCPAEPCLVRLVYGADAPYPKGSEVRAFGHVQGSVPGPRADSKVPEVRVLFFLPGPGE